MPSSALPPVLIQKLHPEAKLPTYATALAAGADLVAAIDEPLLLQSGERALVSVGFSMALPEGYEAQIRPRSGLAYKNGISICNAPGTIDADFRGEVHVLLINHGDKDYEISPGDRVAQMVISTAPQHLFEEATSLPKTRRGEGGFGSTGS